MIFSSATVPGDASVLCSKVEKRIEFSSSMFEYVCIMQDTRCSVRNIGIVISHILTDFFVEVMNIGNETKRRMNAAVIEKMTGVNVNPSCSSSK